MENKVTKKIFEGEVIKATMSKTVVVKVSRRKLHPKYKKYYTVSKKYHIHDEKGVAKVGDKVSFMGCRPISKTKKWNLIEVLKQA